MNYFRFLLLVFFFFSLAACSTLKPSDDINRQYSADPLQGFNRGVYKFNDTADRLVVKPVAKGYSKILPSPVKTGVRNFFNNLGEPLNAANNVLQGKVTRSLTSITRFAINSTVGIAGLFDVAKNLVHIDAAQEDLGQTLAAWGVAPGPYLMLPLLGPSNLRDSLGFVGSSLAYSPINELADSDGERFVLRALDAFSNRASFLGADGLLDAQLDPYGFIKSSFEQSRIQDIYDGTPPVSDEQLESDF